MKLSIIIPVYNVERYLRQCLESCLNQDVPKSQYEVIIVNDGSPDNSQAIIDEYSSKYDNVRVLKKKNGGLSSARNAGLNIASGDYIWFVDSDDWIADVVSILCDKVKRQNISDALCFDSYIVDDNGKFKSCVKRKLIPDVVNDGLSIFDSMVFPYSAVQFYIWKKSFLVKNELLFKEGALYDDWQFILRAFSLMNGCIYLGLPAYYYRVRQNTISTSAKTFRNVHDCIETACDYYDFIMVQKVSVRSQKMLYKGVCRMIVDACKQTVKDVKPIDEKKKCLDWYFSKQIWLKTIFKAKSMKALVAHVALVLYKIKISV